LSQILKTKKIDLIVVGAGLPNETIRLMLDMIERIAPKKELHVMEKTPGMTPVSMISYTNKKTIMWKLMNSRK
jgi:hypothetical protein